MGAERNDKIVLLISKLVDLLSIEEKKQVFAELQRKQEQESIPTSIFRSNLSPLEALVFYLKEEQNKEIKEIACVLNRGQSTIYNTYHKAKKKFCGFSEPLANEIYVPLEKFTDRRFAILESLVYYLNEKNLKLIDISKLLSRGYSTIKTAYHRFKSKKHVHD